MALLVVTTGTAELPELLLIPLLLLQLLLLPELGREISEESGDSREGSFIFQRLSVTIQRSNAALFHESFTRHDDPDL